MRVPRLTAGLLTLTIVLTAGAACADPTDPAPSPDRLRERVAPPADAPVGSTGICKDQSYTKSTHQAHECKAHGGVITTWAAVRRRPY